MVPSSSAQREPSMEEILASIRRIIEDNDAGRKQSPDADASDGGEEAGVRNVIEVDAFRSELRQSPDEAPEQSDDRDFGLGPDVAGAANDPVARADAKPVGGAEPVTHRHVTAERSPAVERSAAEERIRLAIENARIRSAEIKRSVEAEKPSVVTEFSEPEPSVEPEAPVEAEPVSEPGALGRIETDLEQAFAALPAVVETSETDKGPYKQSILSERAERKVAASFGELSEAFAARSQKTFDEMAQEMLQPMLRDWLDNNLPVLVERLVREEIERVARGSQ